jgi:hypothetical protein
MSWNFMVKGATKEEAKAAVMSDKNVAAWKYCPLAVADGICKVIDGVSEPHSDAALIVTTHGYVNHDGLGGTEHGDTVSVLISYGPRE